MKKLNSLLKQAKETQREYKKLYKENQLNGFNGISVTSRINYEKATTRVDTIQEIINLKEAK